MNYKLFIEPNNKASKNYIVFESNNLFEISRCASVWHEKSNWVLSCMTLAISLVTNASFKYKPSANDITVAAIEHARSIGCELH